MNNKKLLFDYIHEIIKKCGSKWCLYSHKGKKLGTHSSKNKAQSQEIAIQISKHKK